MHRFASATIRSNAHFLTSFRRLVRFEKVCHQRPKTLTTKSQTSCTGAGFRSLSTLSGSTTQKQLAPHVRPHCRGYSAVSIDTDTATVSQISESSKRKERVLLLMSGGVDSSICAHILHNQGYDVTGLYMHNWNHQEETQDEIEGKLHQRLSTINTAHLHESVGATTTTAENRTSRTAPIRPKVCTSDRDWADVQAVCEQIGIPCKRLDFSRQYWNQVFEVMLQEYEQGRTPNPDVTCNREIKFGELITWCEQNGGLGKDRHSEETQKDLDQLCGQGWDYLATGHYARVEQDPVTGKAKLLRAKDSNKDQTYYLSTLSEKVLRHVLFPLAQFDKPTVKQMAMKAGESQLKSVASKKESMGICFVGQRRRFGDFLREYLDARPGPVRVNGLNGPLIGEHKGLFQYTVGQASSIIHGYQKWVVLRTDLPSNTLIVVEGTQNKRLFSPGLVAHKWHWISGNAPKKLLESGSNPLDMNEFPFTAQIRHRQTPQPCAIEPVLDAMSPSTTFRVRFKDLQRAIAAGQQIVLYDQDECLGGGVIQAGLPVVAEDE
ncbi:tRNA methyl transferase [Podila verticillata NRRL 6337]|nr:tRNA methyl transferase [Podila verticillata NRRL 6337]